MAKPTEQKIQDAFIGVELIVRETNNFFDTQYYNFHKERYMRMARSICSLFDTGSDILNIGSHYLHTSILFKLLGYEVHSMDVQVFWDLDFVQERSKKYQLNKIVDNDLESFKSHENISDKYNVILFAEIMEHITFNPVFFWKQIHSIAKPEGLIYISTPNSLNLYNITRTIGRVITFRGIGLPVGSIFSNVTYGHHWKEYSASEIRKYFSLLSDDFLVKVRFYHYRKPAFKGFYPFLITILSFIGNSLYFFSDEIEAIIKVSKGGNWKIETPKY